MKITAIVHTHGQPEVTQDTIDSINYYMTDRILVLVDEAGWHHFDQEKFKNVALLKGFKHGFYKAPYRNVILGLLTAWNYWQDSDWFFYIEYDGLVGSSSFYKDLDFLAKNNVWIAGNDYRRNQKVKFSLVELMLKTKFREVFYLLGAVLFIHQNFMKQAKEFFEKFLYYTNDFQDDFFPGYTAWDLTEHLLPTMAKHLGGNIGQFARWDQTLHFWSEGNYRKYPIRWRPDLFLVPEEYFQSSILHPLKTFSHPIREFHRKKRQCLVS